MLIGRRWMIGTTIAIGTAVLLYFLPLFHVVPLSAKNAASSGDSSQLGTAAIGQAPQSIFESKAFVNEFWRQRLLPGSSDAVDASNLIDAIARDPREARKTYGRSVSVGSVYYYFIKGMGRVVSVEKNSIGLAILDGQSRIQVSLEAGPIFGNAVRDGTGLLDLNNFANSQDFNAVSSEINRRIESDVQPMLRKFATMDAKILFVGCVEVTDESIDLQPLRVVPFIAESL